MSAPNSLSNINAGGAPSTATSTGSSIPGSNQHVFDPREVNVDPSKFRIGGFTGEPNSQQGEVALGDVDLNDNEMSSNEKRKEGGKGGPSTPPSTAASTADEKTEQEQAREQREQTFMAKLHSGALGLPKIEDQRPGKRFTLPVEKPKLL
ncbi:hypothetical protein BC939DRAFT_131206 [Gamsiella multidivaricata]|uniref:uncharacterized protein n=1 Tax=Gamsiella multidivaricata TaxID=101098 RepID=UPI00221E57D9|nr:uncharacterized protein BC939DRAFT_131206 [Gamsiella multidivaricata]KAI7825149.1 hypothetical protein BC939DRAFT_131206 [Gamsiella multidivaricata]